ncbi:hypothetical protein [Streptomyces sp. NPDC003077]|uniref:hypothetical protein n=1 Tax=Streptomyces sp. NPDC003077 TaxID=3154443 RepID=UPI0033A4FE77
MVSAQTLARDTLLRPDRLAPGASAGRGLPALPPGERTRIRVGGCGTADAEAVRASLFSVDVV